MIDEHTCELCHEHCTIYSINVLPEERTLGKLCAANAEARRRKAENNEYKLKQRLAGLDDTLPGRGGAKKQAKLGWGQRKHTTTPGIVGRPVGRPPKYFFHPSDEP